VKIVDEQTMLRTQVHTKKRETLKTTIDPVFILLPILYVTGVSGYMIYHRAWFSPDQFFAVAIVATIFLRKTKQFIWDWVPLLFMMFGYEYLRGIVPILTKNAHTIPLILADKSIFGFVPTIKFQSMLFTDGTFHWYDYLSVLLYTVHFIIPMLIAFTFWLIDRTHFKKYTTAFLLLSYAAFLTYIIFPATPPWLASAQGFLPPLHKIMDQVYASFSYPISVPSVYRFFGSNPVAAFPSLHAAYPWLGFLFVRKKSRFLGYLTLLYACGVWFAVIYLGEHYFVDIVAGVAYATMAYGLVEWYAAKKVQKAVALQWDLEPKSELVVQ
jgi:hypothetical protein